MYNGAIIINQIIVLSGSLISGKTYSRILQIAERVFCSICQVEIGFLRIIIDFQESYSWLISYVRSKKLQICSGYYPQGNSQKSSRDVNKYAANP